MSSIQIVLPSGLAGEIRNMKAKELSHIASPTNGKAPKIFGKKKGAKAPMKKHQLDPIFEGCWLSTSDPGPYTFRNSNVAGQPPGIDWGKVVIADRFAALMAIRQLTWGNYEFKVRCPSPICEYAKKFFIWEIDLTDLQVKPLPDASIEKIKAGDLLFPITIGGKACLFSLITGETEANRPEFHPDLPDEQKMLAQVASRLIKIEGQDVDPSDAAVLDWVGDLDAPDLVQASTDMDAVDGGVETRTLISCPGCDLEFASDVPFDDSGFLTPPPKRM